MSLHEKLSRISSGKRSNWLQKAEERLANADGWRNARNIALRVLQLLREQGMTQTQLAEKMGVSRQQVTKIVNGSENLTLETIDKLEKAFKATLMTVHGPTTKAKPLSHTATYNVTLLVTKEDRRLLTALLDQRHVDNTAEPKRTNGTYWSQNYEFTVTTNQRRFEIREDDSIYSRS